MTVPDLAPAAAEVRRLLDGVTDDDLQRPTPSGCDVATLLDHLAGLALAFTWAAQKAAPPPDAAGAPRADGRDLDPRWRELLPERLDTLVAAWLDPSAGHGMTSARGCRPAR